jgi:hypothetical protein
LITAVIAGGIFEACAASEGMPSSPGDIPLYDLFKFTPTSFFSFTVNTAFPGSFTVAGTLNTNEYPEDAVFYVKVGNSIFSAYVFKNILISKVSNVYDGLNSFSVQVYMDNKTGIGYQTNITVDTTIPVSEILSPFPYAITTNTCKVIGKITPYSDIQDLTILINTMSSYPITPSEYWTNNVGPLFEGYNFIDVVINTSNGKQNLLGSTIVFADYTKPVINSCAPSHGAVSVSLTQNISLTFSEAIRTISIPSYIQLQKIGVPVAANYSYVSNQNKVVIDPTLPLEDGVTYTVFVSNAVMDIAGNTFESNCSYSFSTLLPPISSSPAFAGTSLITIFYPTNATIGLSGFSPRLMWDTASLSWETYKFFVLISTAPFQIVGSAVKNKADGVLYWTSDLPLGSDGNIDMLRDTYDIISGVAATSTNYSFVGSQIYYTLIYGVDRNYHIIYSSPVLIFRW